MATLPVRLRPGALDLVEAEGLSPLEMSLAVAWGALASMIAVAGVLMRGVLALSERRAAFVSAVTHELRTPLTTFRMYAEMLAEDMVPAETDRKSYLNTLRSESDRLIHLVENVLAYARLERGSAAGRRTTLTVAELIAAVEGRLRARLAQCGMELTVSAEGAEEARLETDPSAVEQILFNLVDNACKYGGSDRHEVRLEVELRADKVLLSVRDFGPGIPSASARKLFQPFHKSAHEAAVSAPGVGLGLALCRRLARDLGGELRCVSPSGPGACFALELALLNKSPLHE
jgi:signal transduction histidine kinase